ncbi:MAG: lepB [Fibrobacteria bacterium]|jgi:signal peptidase I|nr:lepB [Fibrobacteria bacterium]
MASSPKKSQDPQESRSPWRRGLRAFTREFVVPIALALVFIQFAVQAFKIPSASMERSLLIGDFLLGLKFIYGSPVPFTHKRLPALTEPKPGDVLIFRYPGDPFYPEGKPERYRFLANLFLFGNLYWDRTPAEGENRLVWYAPKDFIKRAVATSGQTLEVEGTRVRVDGREVPLPPEGLYAAGTGTFRQDDPVRDHLRLRLPLPGETIAFDTISLAYAAWIRSLAVQENPDSKVELKLDLWKDSALDNGFVFDTLRADFRDRNRQAALFYLGVSLQQRGEAGSEYLEARNVPFRRLQEVARTGYLRVSDLMPAAVRPQGGRREELNEYYLGTYIESFQQSLGGGRRIRASLVIDGKTTDRYTVKKTSFFMMGDNRDNSSDSRYWGLLSRNNVKAKALIIYFSFENEDGGFRFGNPLSWFTVPFKIRWTRLGRLID